MRSRRKMLLVHGIPEGQDGNLTAMVSASLSGHIKLPALRESCSSRCQRLGQPKSGKSRAILLKFQDVQTKNQVWFAKTALKNSGITLSEFLTKNRHDAFLAARQKFGVSKCWTREGHRVTTTAEVNSIQLPNIHHAPTSLAVASTSSTKHTAVISKVAKPTVSEATRTKRVARK